ncbi:MAG TPA: NAD(P)H-flavin reductase, partial [Legionellaceae bacterium]|nr:NAD(P)H-flavin reductase [Legionellaceae bacterium]
MIGQTRATIIAIQALNPTIWEYVLKPAHYISYQAGQYLQIHQGEHPHFYSIANAPFQSTQYLLHVRQLPHQIDAPIGSLHQELYLSLPYGDCDLAHLHPHKPILFVAAGTGFAPIRAMLYELLHKGDKRPVELHWGVASIEDLYDQVSLEIWQQRLPNFQYF